MKMVLSPIFETKWVGVISTCLISTFALIVVFQDGLAQMVGAWGKEEYSHGYLIPVVAAFLVWRKRAFLASASLQGSWAGALLVVLGISAFVLGDLATVYTIVQYAFLLTITGLVLSFLGWKGIRQLWAPLMYLVFMIPLPNFLYAQLSNELQLVSSELGVLLIRLVGISVFLEGNIIDLGVYKLQVAEACNGLRYLFPLMSFGFLSAYLFRGPVWQKAVLFLSTIPITVFMNSFRIGVIGILVEYWGVEMAEGFLHDFEGWVVFVACLLILALEVQLFLWASRKNYGLRDAFLMESSDQMSAEVNLQHPLPKALIASTIMIFLALPLSLVIAEREDVIPVRARLVTFPLTIDGWRGQTGRLEPSIVQTLQVDDYIVADYQKPATSSPVNFYVAYYDSQRKGASAHSPRSCIPGGGWQITDISQVSTGPINADVEPLVVNRVLIERGPVRQVVYYWFQQRGRRLTNEYLVKWYLFWDGVVRNRTDGALVRLVTLSPKEEDLSKADDRLKAFLSSVHLRLAAYIPE